jgi:cytochrome c-type biogenesis protein CcmE
VLALAGCDYLPFGYTPLKEIVAAPAQFEGREVKVKGKVKTVVSLPVLGRAFTLQDGAEEVMVTTQGALPAAGADVALRGTVRSAVIIGGQSVGLRVEETKRLR